MEMYPMPPTIKGKIEELIWPEELDTTGIDVRHYGAIADKVTDNTLACITALDSLKGQPGTVIFPAGDYIIKDSLPFCSDQHIRMLPGAVIRFSPYTTKSLFVPATWYQGVKYVDVADENRVVVLKARITGGEIIGENANCNAAIELVGCHHCLVDTFVSDGTSFACDVVVDSMAASGSRGAVASYGNRITGVYAASATTANVWFKDATASGATIKNVVENSSIGNGVIGVKVDSTAEDTRISNCRFINNATACIRTDGNHTTVKNCFLSTSSKGVMVTGGAFWTSIKDNYYGTGLTVGVEDLGTATLMIEEVLDNKFPKAVIATTGNVVATAGDVVATTGDIEAVGGYKQTFTFWYDNLAANLTNQELRCHGGSGYQRIFTEFAGSVRSIIVAVTGSVTAGSLTVGMFKDAIAMTAAVVTLSTGDKAGVVLAKDSVDATFTAGGGLRMELDTSADFAGGIHLTVTVCVEY